MLVGMLNVEKIMGDFFFSLVQSWNESVGAKEDLLVCILACCGYLVEKLTLVGNDS